LATTLFLAWTHCYPKQSRMADVNYNTILAIWDNEMKDVAVSTIEKIARALKVEVSELIE